MNYSIMYWTTLGFFIAIGVVSIIIFIVEIIKEIKEYGDK